MSGYCRPIKTLETRDLKEQPRVCDMCVKANNRLRPPGLRFPWEDNEISYVRESKIISFVHREPRSLNGTPGRIVADRISRVNSTLDAARGPFATDAEEPWHANRKWPNKNTRLRIRNILTRRGSRGRRLACCCIKKIEIWIALGKQGGY